MGDEGRQRDNLEREQRPLGVEECRERVFEKFIETGLKELCLTEGRQHQGHQGWSTAMRDMLIDHIKKRGPDEVTMSQVIAELAPVARESFPPKLKAELLDVMFEAAQEFFIVDIGNPAPDPADDKPETSEPDCSQFQSVVVLADAPTPSQQEEDKQQEDKHEEDDKDKDSSSGSSEASEDVEEKGREEDEDSEYYYAEDES